MFWNAKNITLETLLSIKITTKFERCHSDNHTLFRLFIFEDFSCFLFLNKRKKNIITANILLQKLPAGIANLQETPGDVQMIHVFQKGAE